MDADGADLALLSRSKFDLPLLSQMVRKTSPEYHKTKCVVLLCKGQPYYEAPIIVHRCLVPMCGAEVSRGGPLCDAHNSQVYQLKIAKTKLTGSDGEHLDFDGLFTTAKFNPGEKIVPYLTANDVMDGSFRVDGVDPYSLFCNGKHYSALRYRSLGALANSKMSKKIYGARDSTPYLKVDTGSCNAEFKDRTIICTKSIAKGEEVYVNYCASSSNKAAHARREYVNYSVEFRDTLAAGFVLPCRKRTSRLATERSSNSRNAGTKRNKK